MSKIVLITGAAGFIGYHLAKRLRERGDRVIGLDNYHPYYLPRLKEIRATRLNALGVPVLVGDCTQPSLLPELLSEHRITHLVHLAAQAGVRYSLENPQSYIDTNISGFLNILEACRRFPNIPLVYASSSSVYGLNTKVPFATTDSTDAQASLYGVTKKTNELMATTYHHLFGIRATGLRFFTVYGPWGRPDMAYCLFANAILNHRPIQLFNHGHLERDFTYIEDIVAGTCAALDRAYPCEVFNLGNHTATPLVTFVHLLEQALGKKGILEPLPMQPGDVLTTYADIEKSRSMLGFNPSVCLEKGLEQFAQWFLSPEALPWHTP